MAPALILALMLAAANTPSAQEGEPLPSGAPADEYQLAGWCYGALAEYLEIYGQVKPDLVDIDKMFGTPVKEDQPYADDIAAAHVELKVFADAIQAAEKASPQPIAPQGALAIRAGQSIWRPAEAKSRRELARAWLSWGLPDRCDVNARSLQAKASVLGKALSYNTAPTQTAPAPSSSSGDGALTLAPIAPVITHMNPPPPTAPPVQQTAMVVAPPPPRATADVSSSEPSDAGVAAQPAPTARVIQEPLAPAASVAAAAPPRPAPPSAAPAPATPAATAVAPPPTPSDQSAEPVL